MKKKPRQREFGFVNWGGRRRGAGRKPKGEQAGVSHAKRPTLASRFPVLVTLRLRPGLPSLRYDDSHAVLKSALSAGSREEFRVVHYSVQTNHLHLLVESKDERSLARGMIGLAVRIARRLNRLWRRAGQVFADRYHAILLRTPRAVRGALVYVLQNARKHGAWVARRPDVFSSGAWFDGWRGSSNPADSSSSLLEKARTWLLTVGWRRHGLIGVLEAPAHGPSSAPPRAAGSTFLEGR
jgi:REP element-mobilizing transposase RayT